MKCKETAKKANERNVHVHLGSVHMLSKYILRALVSRNKFCFSIFFYHFSLAFAFFSIFIFFLTCTLN